MPIEALKKSTEEIQRDVTNEVKNRMRNPFIFAFILSWIFWNWDFIYAFMFLDEQYVSQIPKIVEGKEILTTKLDYLLSKDLFNYSKSLWFPLFSALGTVLFLEIIITIFNLSIDFLKKKFINRFECITIEEKNKLKQQLKDSEFKSYKNSIAHTDEVLELTTKIEEYEGKIDEEVGKRLKIEEGKNLRRIKELEVDLKKSQDLSSDRLSKYENESELNKQHEETLNKLELQLSSLEETSKLNSKLQKENNELQEKLSLYNNENDSLYKKEYDEFKKKDNYFSVFEDVIEIMEGDTYLYRSLGKIELSYYKVNNIITEKSDGICNYTDKGEAFLKFYLDEYEPKSNEKGNNSKNSEDISVEDIPF